MERSKGKGKLLWVFIVVVAILGLSLIFIGGVKGSAVYDLKHPNVIKADTGKVIYVGILHSLSGTMASSEIPVEQSELLAIKEINAKGGVLGKKIVPIIEDGASDNATFAEKADYLVNDKNVATVFGGWTSSSRIAMKPVFENADNLLWYPVQYEGMESSPNVMYMGAAPNEQSVPAVDFMTQKFGKTAFLVGSDYVYPRTANAATKAQAPSLGLKILGEKYVAMGSTDFSTIITQIKAAKPKFIVNTLNGDSNAAFFKQLSAAGLGNIPVMSFSIAEQEVKGIGTKYTAGNYVSWNYYMSEKNPVNAAFIKAYKAAYGKDAVTDDPIEAGYIAVNIWAKAVEKAGTTKTSAVKAAAATISYDAPEGEVKVDKTNDHLYKTARIGQIEKNGSIETVWTTKGNVTPDPYLKSYSWAKNLSK